MSLRFSVVIPTFNRKESLLRCLRSLAGQTFSPGEFEVIVVDDGSTDGTSDAIGNLRWPFGLSLLREENGGPSAARNLGAGKARGDIIAFTEDDVKVRPDWLKSAAPYFADPAVAVVEGRTVYADSGVTVRRFESGEQHAFIPCNLFIRRETFARVGGYDPSFYDARTGLYFREDADLGMRIMDTGAVVRLAPGAVVEHPRQFATLASCFRHVRRYMFDPLLCRKHPVRFRQMIEVKTLLGMTIHRPQHYLSLAYVVLVAAACVAAMEGLAVLSLVPALGAFVCSILFRYKYQGAGALRLYKLSETVAFLLLPLVYLGSVLKGCFRFQSFGAIL